MFSFSVNTFSGSNRFLCKQILPSDLKCTGQWCIKLLLDQKTDTFFLLVNQVALIAEHLRKARLNKRRCKIDTRFETISLNGMDRLWGRLPQFRCFVTVSTRCLTQDTRKYSLSAPPSSLLRLYSNYGISSYGSVVEAR